MDTRIAAYGVIERDGLILLSHWTEGGRWTLPGGGVEPGEDPADTAVREIFEETGYTARLGGLLGIDSFVIPAAERIHGTVALHSIQIIYAASIVGGELVHEADGSSDEARWFTLDEIAALPRVRHVDVGLGLWRDRLNETGAPPIG